MRVTGRTHESDLSMVVTPQWGDGSTVSHPGVDAQANTLDSVGGASCRHA